MARYIDVLELEKRIKENIKPETLEEKALIEWCKDECIRQAFAIPFVNDALIRADTVQKMQERLKEAPIKVGLPLFGLQTKDEVEDYANGLILQMRDAIDQIAKEMLEGQKPQKCD